MNRSPLDFFLPGSEYMELELRSVEHQGAHEAGGRAQGGRRAPTLMDRVWAPWPWFFRQYFLYFLEKISIDFHHILRTFISAQKQHHGSSAENNVCPG